MNLIFSADRNWAIGSQNKLLFRARSDMRRFKELTNGRVVIMGYNTLISLPGGKPLKNRINIILSRKPGLEVEGAIVCTGLSELFKRTGEYPDEDVFVIGGEQVYRQLMPYSARAYVTKWDKAAAEADSFMENLDEASGWKLMDASGIYGECDLSYTFNTYANFNVKAAPPREGI